MIQITSDEAKTIRKYYPYVHIRRTVNNYYMEESRKALEFISNLREEVEAGAKHGA